MCRESRWLHVLLGIVSIVGALAVLFWPGLALLTFNLIGGWLLVIFGAMSTWSALREPRTVAQYGADARGRVHSSHCIDPHPALPG